MARVLGPGEPQAFSLPKLGTDSQVYSSTELSRIDIAIAGTCFRLRCYLSHPVITVGDLWDVCSEEKHQ